MRSAEGGVHREGRLAPLVLGDRDLVLLGELDQLGAAGQVPFPPGRDDLDIGLEGIIAQLEAHLVVALAGGAMGDRIGAHLLGNLDLFLGDQRPGDGGAQQIDTLIDGVGPEHGKDEVADEFLAHIFDEDVLRLDAQGLGFFPGRLDLLPLAKVGGEGHNLRAIFGLQPFEDHRRIQAAGIGEHDLFDVFLGHGGLHDGRAACAALGRRSLEKAGGL